MCVCECVCVGEDEKRGVPKLLKTLQYNLVVQLARFFCIYLSGEVTYRKAQCEDTHSSSNQLEVGEDTLKLKLISSR